MQSAPYLPRIAAFLIDLLVGALPFWLSLPVIMMLAGQGSQGRFVAHFALIVVAAPAYLCYLGLQTVQYLRRAQTPGRRLMGLETRRTGGEPLSPLVALRRVLLGNVVFVIGVGLLLPPLLLVDPLCALVDRRGRTLHDLLGGTVTVATDRRPPAD